MCVCELMRWFILHLRRCNILKESKFSMMVIFIFILPVANCVTAAERVKQYVFIKCSYNVAAAVSRLQEHRKDIIKGISIQLRNTKSNDTYTPTFDIRFFSKNSLQLGGHLFTSGVQRHFTDNNSPLNGPHIEMYSRSMRYRLK